MNNHAPVEPRARSSRFGTHTFTASTPSHRRVMRLGLPASHFHHGFIRDLQAAGLPALLSSRSGAIAAVTGLCTFPLCLLPSLDLLKYTSFLGIGGILYTAAFMCARISHYAPGTALHAAVAPALQPSFGGPQPFGAMLASHKVFVLLSIIATSYCAHFIAPQVVSVVGCIEHHRAPFAPVIAAAPFL